MRKASSVILSVILAVLLVLSVAPAFAATTEVSVNAVAWFGQDQFSREEKDPLGNTYTVESPNPFCPTAPGSLGAVPVTCAEGRLPTEVRGGNYEPEEQNKISAVGFDLSLVPLGSKVSKFTATFLEAKAGCYEKGGNQEGQTPTPYCEETDPINIEGKELQACFIEGFLTEGEGRPIKEAPRFTCSDSDPVAKRKEVKTKEGDTEHVWSFDLTAFAQRWVKELSATPGIMIVGRAPEKETGQDDNWRVVLTGPKFKAGNIPGVETEVQFVPGKTTGFPDPGDTGLVGTGSSDFGSAGSSDFGSTGSSDFGSTGSSDFGDDASGTGSEAPPAGDDPAPAEDDGGLLEVAGAETAQSPPLPGYVWLAILAGIIGFSLVRSVVLESAAGIRPNGVLAQIQRLNAERTGVAAEAAGASGSAFAPVVNALHSAKDKVGSLAGKFNLRKKG